MNEILLPFLLTLLAGLSTGIGSLIAIIKKRINASFFSISLGFSAGIMVFVAFIELYPLAKASLDKVLEPNVAELVTLVAFFAGIGIIAIIDLLTPENENPHEIKYIEMRKTDHENDFKKYESIKKTGVFMAITIGIHNFPEGFSTFMAGTQDLSVALTVVIAIAIHNIPEGIAVAVPIYFATGSRKKAFAWSFLSGLSEPIGGILGYLLCRNIQNEYSLGISYAIVAGIMVFVAIDELLPSAEAYGRHHHAIISFVFGMLVMAFSMLLVSW